MKITSLFLKGDPAMKTYKIAVIAGDGIGPEVIDEGVKVLKKVSQLDGGFAFTFSCYENCVQTGSLSVQERQS